ncbi:MAG: DUF521 domain-containing protein, partial [Candidatus Altiarchaeales archaeon]|nr:DUF521 domain-containing protein [Candidatus Altiarchaeales archaeon]
MFLSEADERVLAGGDGGAAAKSMRILVALGEIYGADSLIPVESVQIAGVSYHNLGEAGLEYLGELALDGRVKVPTTLNPAGMDLIDWKAHGIPADFAEKQANVVEAFTKMGVNPTCTCTPYLVGVNPKFGSHLAWSESSAVTYVNSVLGARTNKEGGPSALASAICGKTPNYGLHQDQQRQPHQTFKVEAKIETLPDWGALGYAIGVLSENKIPYIDGAKTHDTDLLKSFGASLVTYGAKPMYHLEGVTPEADKA